jgi:transmembrane sensor
VKIETPDADAMKREAAAWIEQRECGAWSADEQGRFNEWLNASLDHRVEYLRVQAAWNRSERLTVLRGGDAHKPAQKQPVSGRVLPILLRVAAACVAIAAVGGAAFYFLQPNYVTYATTIGGRETLTLDDGTQIELNTDTSVRVASNGGERKVWLDKGEAYFQIRHDGQHPFTVVTADLRIVDLGTKFVVRQTGSHLKVSLVEGSARLEPSHEGARPVVLKPGDVALATADSISVSKARPRTLDAQMSWRRDVLVFDRTTLAAAADEFNRYNREKLVVADPAAASRTIGGTFPKNGLVDFAEVARAMLGLKVKKDGDRIVISH